MWNELALTVGTAVRLCVVCTPPDEPRVEDPWTATWHVMIVAGPIVLGVGLLVAWAIRTAPRRREQRELQEELFRAQAERYTRQKGPE
jgi:hypothetical protein